MTDVTTHDPLSAEESSDVAAQPSKAVDLDREGEVAADFLRSVGHPHPDFGDGSVTSRCLRLDAPGEPFCDDRFLRALRVACRVLSRYLES